MELASSRDLSDTHSKVSGHWHCTARTRITLSSSSYVCFLFSCCFLFSSWTGAIVGVNFDEAGTVRTHTTPHLRHSMHISTKKRTLGYDDMGNASTLTSYLSLCMCVSVCICVVVIPVVSEYLIDWCLRCGECISDCPTCELSTDAIQTDFRKDGKRGRKPKTHARNSTHIP